MDVDEKEDYSEVMNDPAFLQRDLFSNISIVRAGKGWMWMRRRTTAR